MLAFVDSDHAGDSITRRSCAAFMVFLNCAPIYWSSKKEGSCETSSFGSEFAFMKSCCKYIRGACFKLSLMVFLVESPTYLLGDNQPVLTKSSSPHFSLKKISSSIDFHFFNEGVSRDE